MRVFVVFTMVVVSNAFVHHSAFHTLSPTKTRLRTSCLSLSKLSCVDGGVGQNFKKAILQGLMAGLVFASPTIDFFSHPAINDGYFAFAQGATSSKSTKAAPSVDANKDPESILRLSLPLVNKENVIREAQESLEMTMDKALREVKSDKWNKIASLSRKSVSIVATQQENILKDISPENRGKAKDILGKIDQSFEILSSAIENKDSQAVLAAKRVVLNQIGEVEQLMVNAFPFEIPAEYSNLPKLKGRATVELLLKKANPSAQFFVDGKTFDDAKLTLVLDGYSAPVTAGNFVDLVDKGFYQGMAIQRSDGFIIQTGKPSADKPDGPEGYVENGVVRRVPLEILAAGDSSPTYGVTLEDDGRYTAQPTLPFSVYGTVAMARSEDEPDSASSQFFFLLFDPELVTAGRNLMDGRYSTFGYVTEGNRLLSNVEVGDVIVSAKVTNGIENLVRPK